MVIQLHCLGVLTNGLPARARVSTYDMEHISVADMQHPLRCGLRDPSFKPPFLGGPLVATGTPDYQLWRKVASRGERDRTSDILLPKQARYRCATPRDAPILHVKRLKDGQRWGLAFSRACILAGKSVRSSNTNGKTALKKAPHINACVRGRGGNLTAYSIRLRSLERRVCGKAAVKDC